MKKGSPFTGTTHANRRSPPDHRMFVKYTSEVPGGSTAWPQGRGWMHSHARVCIVRGMIRVGIVGASGYTGAELLRLIALHPELEVAYATADTSAGTRAADLYPSLAAAYPGLIFDPYDVHSVDVPSPPTVLPLPLFPIAT